ncbi:mechanosensitive ion channel, partial [bacterium]|nr:mechanosensitive ion channel [bacterium]
NELIVLIKVVGNVLIAVVAIILFAQAHELDVFGLIASLGIGGLAIAFAAQKTLEQFLGGIVIYLDKPFSIDDYVGLPDGTFGKVESIGLRSTRIRSSGKGTLIVVPNNALTQMTIENFTGGKKVMAIVYLNFEAVIPENDEALIRQVIVDSTTDIYGIDSRNTNVKFRRTENGRRDKSQAQITFFILGSGEGSMELRRQVLDIANQTLTQTLKDYGIAFEIEEPTYVDSPITI